MIENYKYISPFKILISFHKLVEGLTHIAASTIDYRSNYAKGLLHQIEDKPEFITGITDLDTIQKNQELIHYLLSDLFPTALTRNEIKAATIPFYDFTFNYSERFKTILSNGGMSFDYSIRDLDEHQFYIMNCTLILNAYYHQNIDFGKPLFYDIPDQNGVLKHYKILYNADFIELYPAAEAPVLSQATIDELIDNYDRIDLWKKAFPENSWVLKGFAIISLIDVSVENAVSNLKSNLLKSEVEKSKRSESFDTIFRTVFKIPDLKIGVTFYDEDEGLFMAPPYNGDKLKRFMLLDAKNSDCKNALCGNSFENFLANNQPFIIPDVSAFAATANNQEFGTHLLAQNVQSYMVIPVIKDAKLLGLFELASSKVRALNSINANKLELIMPYISDTIEKATFDMMNQLEAIIQKEYTAIHPSVYWKFKKEAKNYFYSNPSVKNYTFKEIVFKDVFPLYGQIDIKGSSQSRNNAIIADLKEQIYDILSILKLFSTATKIGIIEQKKYELEHFIVELDQPFQNNFEQYIHHYIETEIHPFLKNAALSKNIEPYIENYFIKLDPKTGMFYQTRKDFEDSVMMINKRLSVILDHKQQEAQEIFPHYYERFKTDGVEHNLYIGGSIEPTKAFDSVYLQNLRLWQLETLCEMEQEHHKLKTTLAYPLDVTSLVLAFSAPLSIRFRMDEKRFDVDGSYNARYEVVKKRIDKAFVKNTSERLTQSDKIAIVYNSPAEEQEYLKYIKYLQHKGVLAETIEQLEVEDLQGVSGLKALRVLVYHEDNVLVLDAAGFIKNLFNERLDCNYCYHNLEHTKNVVLSIETICKAEKISEEERTQLLLAGWFHDAGYIDGGENHEHRSSNIASEFLEQKNATAALKQKVTDLILTTTFNYIPQNHLEKIIKDADHAHLSDENYPNYLDKLRTEWEYSVHKKYTNAEWLALNIAFLKKHQYYTQFAQQEWGSLKEINLNLLQKKLQKL